MIISLDNMLTLFIIYVFISIQISNSKHTTEHHKHRNFQDTLTLLNHIQVSLSKDPEFQTKYRDKFNSDTPGQVLYANRIFHTEISNFQKNHPHNHNQHESSSFLSLSSLQSSSSSHKYHQLPILIWEMSLPTYAIGNHLGAYFDTIGCAIKIGAHFIGLTHDYSNIEPFYKAFPTIIPHVNPLQNTSYINMMSKINLHCPCIKFCWRQGHPWESIIPTIRKVMSDAVRYEMSSHAHGLFREYVGLTMDSQTDIMYYRQSNSSNPHRHISSSSSSSSSSTMSTSHITTTSTSHYQYLPLYPDVAIQYRCSDNLFDGMGCLSFHTILSKIPINSKFIYIFSEMPDGDPEHSPMATKSFDILTALINDVLNVAKKATIILKRDSNILITMSIFASANVTICSPSTFCFYPAMARDKVTYFPVGDGKYINISNHINIHSTFHVLREENLFYKNFTCQTSIRDILHTLRSSIA